MLSLLALSVTMSMDPDQALERTCFQTGSPYADRINLRADVAIVYGIDKGMPARVETWRKRGYRIHLMTGVSWGEYQDYLYGRFDGVNHEDEAQTDRNGNKVSHGGDVYYMSPGKSFGKFLCVGVQRALDAGVEAIHLEEPEFWVRSGYSEGFKREWKEYYHEDWQPPHSSPDAQWRASKLKYHLYRRALQQVFSYVQDWNKKNRKKVRCYVPTHSLVNYAHWQIVSPESSLARLDGCDGYIAQVWTGTARTPNVLNGVKKERTFETAFLEYGAMQNLVRATGRRVWYLADPVEDDASHDWNDYRTNWRATLTASLLQPDVWRYEVTPWPERVWTGTYPSPDDPKQRIPIPDDYATEQQVVFNALKDMNQKDVKWECGARGIGVLVSDSLMFQRGEPNGSDGDMSHLYGLALPFLARGVPIQPVQLENLTLKGYLNGFKLILASYNGQKPLTPDVNVALAAWVRGGGTLVFVDDDSDPYNKVRDWWTSSYATPREHLFRQLGMAKTVEEGPHGIGKGRLLFLRRNPVSIAQDKNGAEWLVERVRGLMELNDSSTIVLRRGPYVVAAWLGEGDEDELEGSEREAKVAGNYMSLFNPGRVYSGAVSLEAGQQEFMVDLDKVRGSVVLASGALSEVTASTDAWSGTIEGIIDTKGIVVLRDRDRPTSATVDGSSTPFVYDEAKRLVWVRFLMTAKPQKIEVR